MQRSRWMRRFAAITVLALVLTACGGGDDDDSTGDDTTQDDTAGDDTGDNAGDDTGDDMSDDTGDDMGDDDMAVDVAGRGDGTLTIARVLPETGFLDYLGGPMIAGVNLAIDDINAAGGVLGNDVALLEFDSGTDPAVAGPNVNSALAEGADVIVGAAASGVTQSFLDVLNQNGVYNCSPSATSPSFLEQENAANFFRTVPPDEFVAPIIADEIVNDGNGNNVVIVARSDDYGSALAELVGGALGDLNATVASTIQYTDETTFDAETDEIVGADPSAVVIIGFREAGSLIGKLVDNGLDPSTFYGADGIFSSQLPSLVGGDAGVIDGMKVIGAAGTSDFNERLSAAGTSDFLYGGQAYDCTVLFALWAVAEGNDDTTTWSGDTLLGLTKDGEACDSFEACAALLADGTDIDYNGASGPLALAQTGMNLGNPQFSVYAVASYQDGGNLTSVSSTEVDLTS